jgi:hypothetical protein
MSDADEPTPQPVIITHGPPHIEGGSAHADGYRPICDPLWSTAAIFGAPSRPDTLLILSAARSLDTAHLQIERVRSGLTDIADGTTPIGSLAGRAAMHVVIGDAEHAMIALALVLRVIRKLDRDYDLSVSAPGVVMQKQRLIKRLRDHYSHVDERAFGLVRKKPDVRAEEAFEFGALLASRKFTDGKVSLNRYDQTVQRGEGLPHCRVARTGGEGRRGARWERSRGDELGRRRVGIADRATR